MGSLKWVRDTKVEETVEGVLVNAFEVSLEDMTALPLSWMAKLATIAVGVSDEEDKEMIDGDAFKGLS